MSKKNPITPEITLELTEDQQRRIQPLRNKLAINQHGMILGSVGLNGLTVGLSYVPANIAEEILKTAEKMNEGGIYETNRP